jgi:hypothetical protein
MFRELLSYPQEALHKRHLVHCVRIMSVGCGTTAVSLQPCHSQLTLYARNIPSAVCVAPTDDEQVMLETCRGPWFSIIWIKSALRWFHYTDTYPSKSHILHNPVPCWHYSLKEALILDSLLWNCKTNKKNFIERYYRTGDCLDSCAPERKQVAVSR